MPEDNNGAAAGNDATNNDGSANPANGEGGFNFRDHVSDDYKEKYTEFKTVDDVFKGYDNLATKLGANPLVVPGEKATDEEKSAFNKRINEIKGVPESPDKYEINLPENLPEGFINKDVLTNMKGVLHQNGVGGKEASNIVNAYAEAQMQEYNKSLEQVTTEQNEAISALKEAWGDKYDSNLAKTNMFWAKYSDADDAKALEEKYGNDPVITKVIYNLMKKSGDETFDNPDRGDGTTTTAGNLDELKHKMVELQKSKAYFDVYHADHKSVDAQVKEISRKITDLQANK